MSYGSLPVSLCVAGEQLDIDADYRTAIQILIAFGDPDASTAEQTRFMVETLYRHPEEIRDLEEAVKQAGWFLNCGQPEDNMAIPHSKVYDWEQDEQIMLSAVNHVAGQEVRSLPFLHFWTFMGYLNEIGDCLFTQVIGIRQKINNGEKLEKHERAFRRTHPGMVNLREVLTEEEQELLDIF